jgi:thioesterase domain-containing protein
MYFYAVPTLDMPKVLSQAPIFLFPDVFGNGTSTIFLGQQFLEQAKQVKAERCVYAFHDERLTGQEAISPHEKRLQAMVDELNSMAEYTPYPFILVGHSFGCSSVIQMALGLKALGHNPHVVLLDSVAPHLMQAYLKSQHLRLSQDILNHLNYAAIASKLAPLNVSMETLKARVALPFQEQLQALKQEILDANIHHAGALFDKFNLDTSIMEQNLLSLSSMGVPDETQKLENINVFISQETLNRYGHNGSAAWEAYAKKVNYIDRPDLVYAHTEILAKKNSAALATAISEVINREINIVEIIQAAVTRSLVQMGKTFAKEKVALGCSQALKAFESYAPAHKTSSPQEPDNSKDGLQSEKVLPTPSSPMQIDEKHAPYKQYGLFKALDQTRTRGNGRGNMRKIEEERSRRLKSPTSPT